MLFLIGKKYNTRNPAATKFIVITLLHASKRSVRVLFCHVR